MVTRWSEFNMAVLLNIWPANTVLSLSSDVIDPSEGWGAIFLKIQDFCVITTAYNFVDLIASQRYLPKVVYLF
jgi:hypothetical protein